MATSSATLTSLWVDETGKIAESIRHTGLLQINPQIVGSRGDSRSILMHCRTAVWILLFLVSGKAK